MPFFNYSCPDCGYEEQDKYVTHFDALIICPFCNTDMKKMPSSVNFSIEPAAKK